MITREHPNRQGAKTRQVRQELNKKHKVKNPETQLGFTLVIIFLLLGELGVSWRLGGVIFVIRFRIRQLPLCVPGACAETRSRRVLTGG